MKSSTPIFKILSVAVLVAAVLYFGVQLRNYLADPISTTLVHAATAEDTIPVNGYLVRQEETFSSSAKTLSHEQDEGAKVGIGQIIAVAYDDPAALDTVAQIGALELQQQQLQFALESYLDPDAALKLDGTIHEDLLAVRRDISDGDYTMIADKLSELKAGVMKRDYTYSSKEEIEAAIADTQHQMEACRASLFQAEKICAPASGTYSAICDGYETVLTPDELEYLSADQLEAVTPKEDTSNVGKLIYGDRWYYAGILSRENAALLENRSQVGLRFAKGLNLDLTATIERIGEAENGKCVVVLCCDKYLAQTTALRHQAAELILRDYEGLRVPSNALRVSEDGTAGVYCVVGVTARFKPVKVIYQGDDNYVLVKAADGSEGTRVLRIGDEVIAASGELYDGKVIR